MSPKQEIALAIVLWQQFRQHHQDCGRDNSSLSVIVRTNLPVAERAIQMAEELGVKTEYFRILFMFPVTEITFTELEKWDRTELGRYLTDDSNFTDMPDEPSVKKMKVKVVPWAVSKGRKKLKK